MPGEQMFENSGISSYSLPSKFKQSKVNAFRRFPANCGAAPAPLAALSDATHLKPNAVAESALGYSTVDLAGKFPEHHSLFATGINRRKGERSGNGPDGAKYEVAIPAVPFRSVPTIDVKWKPEKSVSSHDKDYDEGQTANATDNNTVHQKEELWKHVSDKLAAVIAEAKQFINLLDCRNSTSKTLPAVEEFINLLDSRESKDQLPSLESDAFHPRISIGEQKPMMETVKQGKRERDKILAESVMPQNLDNSLSGKSIKVNSGISVVVQEEKASGTETMSEDSEDEFSLLSPAEWNVFQFQFNHKDDCAKPSIGKLEKKLERRSSLKFARKGRNVREPQGIKIVDFIDPISVGTKSDQPSEWFPDCELTETKCREHQRHVSTDLDECSTVAKSEHDEPLKMFSINDESVAMYSYRSTKATNSNNEPEYCEKHKEQIDLEMVRHDQPQGRKVMQTLKLFKEEYFKLLQDHKSEPSGGKTIKYPHLEAAVRVKEKGMCVSNDKPFGHIPGIEIGDEFRFRGELVIVGLHCQFVAGIDYYVNLDGKKYATSVVNSGGYENRATPHDTLIYSGQGGNPKVSNNVAADQKLENGNLALRNSMEMGYPVRVIQKRKCLMASKTLGMKNEHNSAMYVYDGLYTVNKFWHEREAQNHKLVFRFQLQRLPGQPISHGTDVKLGKRTEVCVLDDVSQGKENFKVRVLNGVDDDLPLPLTYITNIVYPHWYRHIEPIGCNCINGCSDSEQCPCVVKNGGKIPFTEKGAILKAYPNIVHECGPSCKCPPSCMNRVSQHGPRRQLEIFKTKAMGWGVRSRDWIMPGSFISEYIGELVRDKEADQRIDNEYLFDICHSHDEEGGFEGYPNGKMKDDGISLDAAKCGNIGRFINHSCDPNVFAQEVLYDNDDKRMPHVMFFAAKRIPPGRELGYDYKYRNSVGDANGNIKTKACHCGFSKCTGRM